MSKRDREPEEMLLVCQCGSSEWVSPTATRTAVMVRCAECGLRSAVKSYLRATGRDGVRVVSPTGEDAAPLCPPKVKPRRFTAGLTEDAHRVCQIALHVCRIEHGIQESFVNRNWAGAAIEAICADYIAGQDPELVAIAAAHYDRSQQELKKAGKISP